MRSIAALYLLGMVLNLDLDLLNLSALHYRVQFFGNLQNRVQLLLIEFSRTYTQYAVFFGFRGQSKFRLAPTARLNLRYRLVLVRTCTVPHLRIYIADSYYTTYSPSTEEIRVEPRIVF